MNTEELAQAFWQDGYLVLNDFTDRKIQKADVQNCRAKGFDTFCPIGPALVTRDEIRDPGNLSIQLSVDGEIRQKACTSSLIHDVGAIVEFATAGMTLEPGEPRVSHVERDRDARHAIGGEPVVRQPTVRSVANPPRLQFLVDPPNSLFQTGAADSDP